MDVDEFYDGDPRRGESPEVRFGAHWLDEAEYAYAIAWLEQTGELIAVRQVAHPEGLPPALLAMSMGPMVGLRRSRDRIETEVFVLMVEPSRKRVDTLLEGWPDSQAQPGGFEELVGQLDKAGYPPPW